jgi:sigma-B regulation protein RsbU (phosphoserine phosphatase)
MEQSQFKVRFALGTKLVLSLSILFAVIIGFLSYSAVVLVVEDKKAYVYQLQSIEALMVSRDFTEKAKSYSDNLRLYLSSFDPRQSVTPAQVEVLNGIAKNQTESPGFFAYLVKPDGSAKLLTRSLNPRFAQHETFDFEKVELNSVLFSKLYPALLQNTFEIENLSSSQSNWVGFFYADVSLKDFPGGMPVVVGLIDPAILKQSRRFGELMITKANGEIIAASQSELNTPKATLQGRPLFQSAIASKIQAGTKEFYLGEQRYLGAYQRTSYGPLIFTQMEWKKAMAAAYTMGERFIVLGVISILLAIIFAIIFSNTITRPLKRLLEATSLVSSGDFAIDPKITSRDEVGQLASSFIAMSKKIQMLLIETVQKAQMQEELKVAAAVQESLIPPSEYHDDNIEIISHYQSATECGGDWWGFFRVGNKICVMIADATGHGVPSALITASARSCFSVLHKLAAEKAFFRLAPGEMMSYANRVVFDAATTKIMMTFFIGVIDLDAKTLTYSNAGHNPPWLFRHNGERFVLNSLLSKGNRLGEVVESGEYEEMTVPMGVGDILVMYTDGLVENTNLEGTQFGKKRTKVIMEENLKLGPQGIIDGLIQGYKHFTQGKSLDDDITLAAIKIVSNQ